jgi:hypothetical protein
VTIFGLSCYPGFLFFPAALEETLQRQLAYEALKAYCEPPHRINIELVAPKSSETVLLDSIDVAAGSMWGLWSKQPSTEDEQNPETKHSHQQHLRYYRCFEKLSWATLGYIYDWTQRCYHEDDFSPFSPDPAALGRVFAQLSRHRDELELALDKPTVSISLGRSAVFVLGGKTLQDGPIIPMIVRRCDSLGGRRAVELSQHGPPPAPYLSDTPPTDDDGTRSISTSCHPRTSGNGARAATLTARRRFGGSVSRDPWHQYRYQHTTSLQ